ncbi:MAG: hypothetical protein A4E40_00887 [Methanoregulaceae archaeon PtaU1.Bin059]|nr:MAG: hypothetical protein A4E39_01564 [Methanoregulaceae archaeon PtaB.Bin152]OPY40170.1 MAG: hypothetical protein A4E40_00887 [Methanoregulaceae archaeon PtaU1.Bin059]
MAILLALLGVVVVMAVVVKPVLTGNPPDLSLPSLPGFTPEPTPAPQGHQAAPTQATPRLTVSKTPTPTPTWSGTSKSLGYVAVETPLTTPTFTRLPEETPVSERLLTYATIQAVGGGTTQTISMPFPYWELHYTVDPWKTTFVGTTSSKMAGQADFFAAEVFPSFSIEVRDAADHSLVRKIEPRGGLDATLWEKEKDSDPRPWVEKFYEGTTTRSYYFVVHTHMVYSYKMEVKVPERYLGKY